jgi:hypothetical protein
LIWSTQTKYTGGTDCLKNASKINESWPSPILPLRPALSARLAIAANEQGGMAASEGIDSGQVMPICQRDDAVAVV